MTSFAATSIAGATSLGANVAFAPSKSVTVMALSNATNYAATSGHLQGTEYYGVLSSDTSVYFTTVANPAGDAATLNPLLSGYISAVDTLTGLGDTK
jgi:hypothetical protein